MIRFIILLLPALVFADAGLQLPETMSNVMVVVNINDTLDSDGDGLKAWQEYASTVDSISDVRGEACYICSLKTRYSWNNSNYPQAIQLDQMWSYLDHDTNWVSDTSTHSAIAAGDDYLIDKLVWCARQAEALTGVYPKYFNIGPGVGRLIRANTALTVSGKDYRRDPADADGVTATAYDSTVCKSVDDFIELYFRPDADTVWNAGVKFNGYWGSRYIEAARGAAKKGFVPGVYRQYKSNGGVASDSTLQWVIVTRCDGFDDNVVCDMVRRAFRGEYNGWESDGTPNHWAVIEAENAGLWGAAEHLFAPVYADDVDGSATYGWNSRFYHDADVAFGSQKLFDLYKPLIDTSASPDETLRVSIGGIPDTCSVYFGYSGAHTLSAGDSALLYWTCASYHDGGSPIPESIAYETEIAWADGSLFFSPESWNIYLVRDTAYRVGSDDQSLCVEWLDAGMTYAIGRTREVNENTRTQEIYLADAMFTPEVPFAVVGELATTNKAQTMCLGWPGCAWRQAAQSAGTSAAFSGVCDEAFSFSTTTPSVTDSVLILLSYDNGSTTTVRQNSSPSAAFSYSVGARWISSGLSGVTVSYKDALGNLHSEEVFTP